MRDTVEWPRGLWRLPGKQDPVRDAGSNPASTAIFDNEWKIWGPGGPRGLLIRWPHKGAGFDPLIFLYLWRGGRVWFNAAVPKTAGRKIRGFESHSLRHHEALSLKSRPNRKERRLKPARGQNTRATGDLPVRVRSRFNPSHFTPPVVQSRRTPLPRATRVQIPSGGNPFNQRGQNQDWSKSALRKHRTGIGPLAGCSFHSVKAGEWTA